MVTSRSLLVGLIPAGLHAQRSTTFQPKQWIKGGHVAAAARSRGATQRMPTHIPRRAVSCVAMGSPLKVRALAPCGQLEVIINSKKETADRWRITFGLCTTNIRPVSPVILTQHCPLLSIRHRFWSFLFFFRSS